MTDRELMQRALDVLEKLADETPTTHVRVGKANFDGKEIVALWFDDCSDPLQQARYINATKPEKLKEFLKQVRDRLAQPDIESPASTTIKSELHRLHKENQALNKCLFQMQEAAKECSYPKCQATNGCVGACSNTAPPSIEAAIAAEREACADLCEEHFMSDGDWCAKRIRARSEK